MLQGLGGGMIMPAGMTILTRAAGPQRIGRVMAIMGVPMLLGPILGPDPRRLAGRRRQLALDLLHQPAGRHLALMLSMRVLPRDVAGRKERLDCSGCCWSRPAWR